MNSWYALLVVSILFMAGVIAGCCYLWYEHNVLIRKVQALEHRFDTMEPIVYGDTRLIEQVIEYQDRDNGRLMKLKEIMNVGHSETQSDDVPMGGR